MKSSKILGGLTIVLGIFLCLNPLYACGGGSMMGGGGGMMGGRGGMMGGRGGMMGQSGSMGAQPQQKYGPQKKGQVLTQNQARQLVESHLKSTKNPNLRLGKISEGKDYFEVEIVTRDGSLVDKVRVDKYTGNMRSVYSY